MDTVGLELIAIILVCGPHAAELDGLTRLQLDHLADNRDFIIEAAGVLRHKTQHGPARVGIVKDNGLDNAFNRFLLHTDDPTLSPVGDFQRYSTAIPWNTLVGAH